MEEAYQLPIRVLSLMQSTRISINYDLMYVLYTTWNRWIPSLFLGSLLMTAQLSTGTLLGTIVYGNSCKIENHAVYPTEKYRKLFFFSAIIQKHRNVILPFHAYKGAKQKMNMI
jgi:hypothetical protein